MAGDELHWLSSKCTLTTINQNNGRGCVKPFHRKYAAVQIAALENCLKYGFSNNGFHCLIKLITFASISISYSIRKVFARKLQ